MRQTLISPARWIAVTLTLSLAGFESRLHADLLTNGSFENATGGSPDNWNPSGNLQVISGQGETDGVRALAFSFNNVPSTGVIFQSFTTVVGTQYNLTFDFGKYSVNQPLQQASLDVDVFDGAGFAGTQLLDQTVIDLTPGTGDPDSTDSADVYSSFQFNFSALSTTSTLRFTDVSDAQAAGGGFDAMLDNVSVTAVPEASSFAFLSLATAFFAATRSGRLGRRKRH